MDDSLINASLVNASLVNDSLINDSLNMKVHNDGGMNALLKTKLGIGNDRMDLLLTTTTPLDAIIAP